MAPSKSCVGGSSSLLAYISRDGVDDHAIEICSKLHPYTKNDMDENILYMFKNTLVFGPHLYGKIPEEMAKLFKEDVEASLCYQNPSLAFHSWVSKNMSRSYPSSEVRSTSVKW